MQLTRRAPAGITEGEVVLSSCQIMIMVALYLESTGYVGAPGTKDVWWSGTSWQRSHPPTWRV